MSENIILSFDGVYKIFKGTIDTVALDNLSYDIPSGKLVAIYGPSGSGKSTFLKCAGNIWKPTTGRIYFEEEEVHKYNDDMSSKYRINNVGFVFQELNLIPSLNVSENIELPMQLSGKGDKEYKKNRIQELLEKFGISRYKKSFPDELSGGEQQRVAMQLLLQINQKLFLLMNLQQTLIVRTEK